MSGPWNPEDDFGTVTDGLVAVRLTRPGTSIAVDVPYALARPTQLVRVERSDGQYTVHDLIWHLPADELPVAPQPGDLILLGQERWTVLSVQAAALGNRWRCVARNLAALWGLDQYLDVEEALFAQGEQGDERPQWRTTRAGVRAKIQPVASAMSGEPGRSATVTRYRIYCAEPLELTHRHRLRGPDGTIYQILAVQKPERIDAMLEIEVERRQ